MLFIVATPIGNPKDITLRGIETLQMADSIIGEEQRVASTFLKKHHLSQKPLYCLNEHTREDDLEFLVKLCQEQNVALISDCGTPSFYDPGYQLVKECRKKDIPITSVPGASSLMALMSLVSQRVNRFYFAGFLAADNLVRSKQILDLQKKEEPIVLMDTPYRLIKLISELIEFLSQRTLLLGLNLTQDQELVLEGTPQSILKELQHRKIEKAEFVILIYQNKNKVQKVINRTSSPGRRRR